MATRPVVRLIQVYFVLAVLIQQLQETGYLSVHFSVIISHDTYPRRTQTSTAGSDDSDLHGV